MGPPQGGNATGGGRARRAVGRCGPAGPRRVARRGGGDGRPGDRLRRGRRVRVLAVHVRLHARVQRQLGRGVLGRAVGAVQHAGQVGGGVRGGGDALRDGRVHGFRVPVRGEGDGRVGVRGGRVRVCVRRSLRATELAGDGGKIARRGSGGDGGGHGSTRGRAGMADAAAPGPRRGWEVRGDVVARWSRESCRVRVTSCRSATAG